MLEFVPMGPRTRLIGVLATPQRCYECHLVHRIVFVGRGCANPMDCVTFHHEPRSDRCHFVTQMVTFFMCDGVIPTHRNIAGRVSLHDLARVKDLICLKRVVNGMAQQERSEMATISL